MVVVVVEVLVPSEIKVVVVARGELVPPPPHPKDISKDRKQNAKATVLFIKPDYIMFLAWLASKHLPTPVVLENEDCFVSLNYHRLSQDKSVLLTYIILSYRD